MVAHGNATRSAWTFFDSRWHEGNPMFMGPMTHAPWLGSCVFDGARAFEGVAPDFDRHCEFQATASCAREDPRICKRSPG